MWKARFKESFPGSGVTEDGTRINPNMKDYGNSPCVIRKVAQARATAENPGVEFLLALCKKRSGECK